MFESAAHQRRNPDFQNILSHIRRESQRPCLDAAHTPRSERMARLAKGRLRYERYKECMQVMAVAMFCALFEEEELFVMMIMFGAMQLEAYEELVAPTTLEGVYRCITSSRLLEASTSRSFLGSRSLVSACCWLSSSSPTRFLCSVVYVAAVPYID